jgi:hypothetical protein
VDGYRQAEQYVWRRYTTLYGYLAGLGGFVGISYHEINRHASFANSCRQRQMRCRISG